MNNANVQHLRKLPRWVRKLNVVYQLLLLALMGANGVFAVLESNADIEVPKVYYQICSVALAALPVAWTKFLDSMKEYQDTLTPTNSVSHSPPHSIDMEIRTPHTTRLSSAPN